MGLFGFGKKKTPDEIRAHNAAKIAHRKAVEMEKLEHQIKLKTELMHKSPAEKQKRILRDINGLIKKKENLQGKK